MAHSSGHFGPNPAFCFPPRGGVSGEQSEWIVQNQQPFRWLQDHLASDKTVQHDGGPDDVADVSFPRTGPSGAASFGECFHLPIPRVHRVGFGRCFVG